MVTKQALESDLRQAQKDRDQTTVDTLRLVLSAVKNAEIAAGGELDEAALTKVLQKEAKQRIESIESFRQGGRDELADKEQAELEIIEKYLPKAMADSELDKIIGEVFDRLTLTGMGDMGKVMSAVSSKVAGRADSGRVAQKVKDRLAKL